MLDNLSHVIYICNFYLRFISNKRHLIIAIHIQQYPAKNLTYMNLLFLMFNFPVITLLINNCLILGID